MSLLANAAVGMTVLAKTVSEEKIQDMKDNPDKLYFPFFGDSDNIFNSGFSLDNVMFTVPGTNFQVYWYGFLIALGMLLAMIYGYRRMKRYGIDPDRATDAIIAGVIGAIFGARLYYILFSGPANSITMKDFFHIRDGGLAIYGGLIGAILVGGIVAKLRKLKLTALLDIAGPAFLIGQAVGRWGNFFNVEAYGSNTTLPWGMMSASTMEYLANVKDELITRSSTVVDPYLPVHPCFLYESLWCILGFILINLYAKHRKFDGELFLMYIGWYGLGRFFIEGLRTDSLYIGNIRVSQLVAGTCVIAAVVLILVFRGMVKRSGDYKFFYETDLSKAQLAEAVAYEENEKARTELKKKIRAARENGDPTLELENEYDEKFGKKAREARKAAKHEEQDETDEELSKETITETEVVSEEEGWDETDTEETADPTSENENPEMTEDLDAGENADETSGSDLENVDQISDKEDENQGEDKE